MAVNTFLWLDFETTGLDPVYDDIIEVGCVLTDRSLRPISRFQSLVVPRQEAFDRAMQNSVVREMHERTGLLDELRDFATDNGVLKSLWYVEADLVAWLDAQEDVDTSTMFLCGSGVSHFDHALIKDQMPRLAKRLRYATLDVSVVTRFLDSFVGPDYEKLPRADSSHAHRALYDAERAVESATLLSDQLSFLVNARSPYVDQETS